MIQICIAVFSLLTIGYCQAEQLPLGGYDLNSGTYQSPWQSALETQAVPFAQALYVLVRHVIHPECAQHDDTADMVSDGKKAVAKLTTDQQVAAQARRILRHPDTKQIFQYAARAGISEELVITIARKLAHEWDDAHSQKILQEIAKIKKIDTGLNSHLMKYIVIGSTIGCAGLALIWYFLASDSV